MNVMIKQIVELTLRVLSGTRQVITSGQREKVLHVEVRRAI